jgi:hypothetical protein
MPSIERAQKTPPDVSYSGYGSPSEDFELSEAPVVKTVTGNEPEQVGIATAGLTQCAPLLRPKPTSLQQQLA